MKLFISSFQNRCSYAFIAFIAFIVILNPYLAGPLPISPGPMIVLFILSLFVISVSLSERYSLVVNYKFLITTLAVIIFPHIVSFFNEAQVDFNLLKIQISVFIMILFGFCAGYILRNYQNQSELPIELCKIFVGIVFLNALVVLLEFYYPSVRSLLESLLVPDARVDYANGLRFRGLASAGGASLSVAHGLAVPMAYYLFRQKIFGPMILLLSVSTLLVSLIFIGRTGFIVAALGILLVFVLTDASKQRTQLSYKAWVFILFIASLSMMSYLGIFYDSLPSHYQNYSINVFLGGSESLKSEGTVSYVISFYDFPDDPLALVLGVGNFSGGFDLGYSLPGDPGIMKILTAYGISGLLFYVGLLVWCFSLPKSYLKDILVIICILLIFTELKEPLLFKGYSSRFFWLLVGVMLYQKEVLAIRLSNKLNL